jgi:excisionase family DNA binding protein
VTETIQRPLNVKEAAEFLNLKPSYIYNLVHYGKLPVYKPGGKILLFKQSELEEYAFRNKQSAEFELAKKADRILNGAK